MLEPSNSSEPALQDAVETGVTSPWVMAVTMLLLICGFALTATLLLRHAPDNAETASAFSITRFLNAATNAAAPAAAATADNPDDTVAPHGTLIGRLFGEPDTETVRWPRLKLTGFGRSADSGNAFAIINGRNVVVDSCIGDVRLVEIRQQGVVVEYQGEQRLLTVEQPDR